MLMAFLILAGAVFTPQERSIGWQMPVPVRTASSPVKVAAGDPFESVALSWSASSELRVRIRASGDSVHWTEWIEPLLDDDLTSPGDGRYRTAIVHFGSAQQVMEVLTQTATESLVVTFFPQAVRRERRQLSTSGFTLGSVEVRSRQDWGCPEGEGSGWTPVYTAITHAVVHHTAGSNSLTDWEAEVRSIWYFHTFSNGWGDIGYNFLIDPNGVVYEGRAGGMGAIGAHFSCRNTNTVGVALLGTFSSAPPSAAAVASLERLLTELCRRNGLDPGAVALHVPSGLTLPTIIGHRDGNASALTCSRTECPGDVLYSLLPSIRAGIVTSPLPGTTPRRRSVRP